MVKLKLKCLQCDLARDYKTSSANLSIGLLISMVHLCILYLGVYRYEWYTAVNPTSCCRPASRTREAEVHFSEVEGDGGREGEGGFV